jgi:5'-3' exonuclease
VYKIEDFAVPVQQKDSFAATSKSFVAMDVKLKKANESAARTLRENLFTAGTSTSVKSEDSAKFEYEDSSEVVGRKRKLSAEEATVETVGPEEESVEDEEDEDGNAKPSKELKVEESSTKDDVRLWESGWRERYYRNKFDIDPDDMEFRKRYDLVVGSA